MALFNEILASRFNRFAQKYLSMKGGPVIPTLSTDLQLVLPIQFGNDTLYLQSVDLFGATYGSGKNAAGVSGFRVRNPSTSGVVLNLLKFTIQTDIADAGLIFEHGASIADYTAVNTATPLDGRNARHSSAVISVNSAASVGVSLGAGTALDLVVSTPATRYDLVTDQVADYPLLPGFALNVFGATNNVLLRGTVVYLERVLESSETS